MPLFKGIIWILTIYPPRLALRVIAAILGVFILPFVIPFSYHTNAPDRPIGVSQRHTAEGWKYKRLPGLFNNIWGNYKYGSEGNWFWFEKYQGSFCGAYLWLAIRNPANNMDKFTEIKDPVFYGSPVVDDVNGIAGFQFAVDGWKAGLYFIIPLNDRWCVRCRLGYKIDRNDRWARLSYLPPMIQKFGR